MRTPRLVLFFLLTITVHSNTQTIIPPGNVSGTWTLSGSPYQVTGDVTIPNDSTLTIEPGALVEFQGWYALNVQGRFLAAGTHTDTIKFTVNDTTGFYDPDTTLGGWYGIRMIDLPQTNDTTRLEYCKIEYGKAVGPGWFQNAGGGICVLHFDKVVISNCIITNCSAGGSGFAVGGAIAVGWSDIRLTDNVISHNKADAGGGIHFYESDPTLINNTIEHNAAYEGGGLDIQAKSHPILVNNRISQNDAFMSGGGMNIVGDSASVVIDSCTIADNSAQWGAGVRAYQSELSVMNSLFENNRAVVGGGGMNFDAGVLNIENTEFRKNWSDVGGGIRLYNASFTLNHSTVLENTAVHSAGLHADSSQLIIANTSISNNSADIQGGGVRFFNSNLTISNSSISGNHAGWGGGMAAYQSDVSMNNCTITENSAAWGGGVQSELSRLEIYGTDVGNNVADSNGAGLRLFNSILNIDHCLFSGNSAAVDAGAIEYYVDTLDYPGHRSLLIENSTFSENHADGRFAGVRINQYNSDTSLVDVTVHQCLFKNNDANSASALRITGNIDNIVVSNTVFDGNITETGTSIFGINGAGEGEVRNCVFTNNTQIAATVAQSAVVDVINCTFANNFGPGSPALNVRAGATANVVNSIFRGNGNSPLALITAGSIGCTLTVNFSDVENGVDSIGISDSLSIVQWGIGNLLSDPLFADSANGDVHLQDYSPCIGAGTDSIQIGGTWAYAPLTDIEEHARPDPAGSRPDMGAFENSLGDPLVGIPENGKPLPGEFRLYQNYPNPFNPATTIRFDLPISSVVTLKVCNVLGQDVKSLVNERREAGRHTIEFDGSRLPSGVYLYKIASGSCTITHKMLLIR
ncbi:MAG TPA: right-handed parallel beta-helix repeat-containing protein [Bacteroidota bacterium]|nr:right-handed parallel beta-helix repeat-containing protein [Bacteroidota bacterium]